MPGVWEAMRPKVRERLAPYKTQIEEAARRHGVPADVVYMLIAAESSGIANAAGDKGKAQGVYQVQTQFLKDYGFTADTRMDPVAASNAIMPELRRRLDRAGGDWGQFTIGYNRGEGSAALKKIRAGVDPAAAFGSDAIGLGRYREAVALQQRFGGRAPDPVGVPAGPVPERVGAMYPQPVIDPLALLPAYDPAPALDVYGAAPSQQGGGGPLGLW